MRLFLILACLLSPWAVAQEAHDHPAPEKLGTVFFPTSCSPATQGDFDRAVALLHSFAYRAAADAFRSVAAEDPRCAIAHWGIAMTYFHELWEPPLSPAAVSAGEKEIAQAALLQEASDREHGLIHALSLVFEDASTVPYRDRAQGYESAMSNLAAAYHKDVEVQVFYALALLANASPADKTHRKQKQAADLLEPLYRLYPNHPGIPHYLIHACDNAELASRGLAAARAYAGIAPSAPHALHMPSHIFTRLGLWDDSIASNLAARDAARQQDDTGEQLHAMDYLVYAYLQSGRDEEAAHVIEELKAMPEPGSGDFKVSYAATVMPIRTIVERQRWSDAEKVLDPPGSPLPQVLAVTVWARGLGYARNGRIQEAEKESERLHQIGDQLVASGNSYWAAQTSIMRREVLSWTAQAKHQPGEAVELLRSAADDEDAMEKLPVTPGPIVPAREQLGQLYLEQGNGIGASKAFAVALVNAPARRGALVGAATAKQQLKEQ